MSQVIYDYIELVLLWYNFLSSTLQKIGYEINPYDRCVAKKIIQEKKCTIAWYIDNNKISHVNEDIVTRGLKVITEHFGELEISRGKKMIY